MNVLVTGASGFLGGAVARALLSRGALTQLAPRNVRVFARRDMPELARLGATVIRGDLGKRSDVIAAVEGCDAVVHVGAKAEVWGDRAAFQSANVDGTRYVLEGCKKFGVRRLVFTSSPSVVHGASANAGVDESVPYATHYESPYPETKAAAERLVLAANGHSLATIALRPPLIWGPGDEHLLPRLIDRARRGRLVFPGDGHARIDTTYIDSAVEAHLLALDRLSVDASCAGRAYFVSQGEPVEIQILVNKLLAAAGLAPVHRKIPAVVARTIGSACELVWRITNQKTEPPLTRFVAQQMSTARFFDISAARRDLGYGPKVSFAQGLEKLQAHFLTNPI